MFGKSKTTNMSTTCTGCMKYCLLLVNGHHLCNYWGPINQTEGCKYYTASMMNTETIKINSYVKYCKDCTHFKPLKMQCMPIRNEKKLYTANVKNFQ